MVGLFRTLAATGLIIAATGVASADDRGSKEEAKALLDKAVAHVNAVGMEKAFVDFSQKDGGFIDRDLYVFCYDLHGNVLAHGGNPTLIGKNLIDVRDTDGIQPVKASIEIVQASGQGTLDFKWPNPVTKKIESKSSFVVKVGENWCGVGYYRG
jgi:cytochrome c